MSQNNNLFCDIDLLDWREDFKACCRLQTTLKELECSS